MSTTETSNNSQQFNYNAFWFITFWGLFTTLMPNFVKLVLWIFFKDSQLEKNLRKQITELKTELGTINMTQEFVKYAKIQRKINKMTEDLKNRGNTKTMLKLKVQVIVYGICYVTMGLTTTYLIWSYRYTPLARLDHNLLFPLGPILAFPTGVEGAIGITCWFSMVTYSSRTVKRILSST
ncbi:guided entry of tail-anchored proteins factor 1-like [Panonychus citri]|uniref:guided entry of tail-anchored proteins factor 1-like n=1 Tax=Panonychus citri TaxID=50023 RepID=UPI0023080D38|nr:guided entry of tail-anchored proteins factor 1-like [Panonychus citri]